MKRVIELKKKEIIISIILISICLLLVLYLFVLNIKDDTKNKSNSKKYYLVIDNVSNLMYINNKWFNTTISEIEKNDKYITYSYNDYLGINSLKYGNVWNLFNNNGDFVNYKDNLFAYSDSFNIKKKDTNIRNITEVEKNEIIKNFNYLDFNHLLSNEVIDIDLDSNGVLDKIVCVSNIDGDKNFKDKYYNLVYIYLNNNEIIQIINENSNNYNILKTDVYDLSYIFSINKKNYFLLKKSYNVISASSTKNIIMYDYTNINKISKVEIK